MFLSVALARLASLPITIAPPSWNHLLDAFTATGALAPVFGPRLLARRGPLGHSTTE